MFYGYPPEYDYPEEVILSTTHPIAKKQHTCSWCREGIKVGEKYTRIVGIVDGKFSTMKEHYGDCMRMDYNETE